MRTCKCGGIIREDAKPYWDTLPSCSCQNPEVVPYHVQITSTTTPKEEKIAAGAKDFSERFEGVMKDLAEDTPTTDGEMKKFLKVDLAVEDLSGYYPTPTPQVEDRIGKLVELRWRDSRMYLTQCHKDDKWQVSTIISCGYVVAEDERKITLASDLVDEDGDIRRVIVIPKENII